MTLVRVGKLVSEVVENCRTKIEKKKETAGTPIRVSSLSNDPGRQQNGSKEDSLDLGRIAEDVAGFPAIEEGHELDLQR